MKARSLVTGANPDRRAQRGRFVRSATALGMAALCVAAPAAARAQRHSLGSAPPTAPAAAPPAKFAAPGSVAQPSATPVAPVSSGLGAIQIFPANLLIPGPEGLTRELSSDDERTRSGALNSLGAPPQYLGKGHVPFPHSVQLDLVQLGESDQLDALVTVELDQHIITAVLVPQGDTWRRIATIAYATPFSSTSGTPSVFVRPLRSWLQPDRYRAVFHATMPGTAGDFTENEADINVINNHAVVVLDFVSAARQCDPSGQLRPPHQSCELIQRWLEPDPADPNRHFTLITGFGHFSAHEANDPLSRSHNYRLTHLRAFTCQPFVFSETAMHFEPTANAAPCYGHEPLPPHAEHPEGQHPDTTKPGSPETPKLTSPDSTKPEPSRPETAKPDSAKPETTKAASPDSPKATNPETAKPATTEPAKAPNPDTPKPPTSPPQS